MIINGAAVPLRLVGHPSPPPDNASLGSAAYFTTTWPWDVSSSPVALKWALAVAVLDSGSSPGGASTLRLDAWCRCQLIAPWGDVLQSTDVPSTLIIGVHRRGDEVLRIRDYSPGENTAGFTFDPAAVRGTRKLLRRRRPPMGAVASTSTCLLIERRYSRSRPGESWHSPWGFAIPKSTGAIFCASPGGGCGGPR